MPPAFLFIKSVLDDGPEDNKKCNQEEYSSELLGINRRIFVGNITPGAQGEKETKQ